MSIAAYPQQTTLPSYVEFEPGGGQNNGSAWVLRGQSSGAPTIIRPRRIPIQEASMSVSLEATVNTLNNNPSSNGYEGLAPTFELLRVNSDGPRVLWSNALLGSAKPQIWKTEKRDWHKLTWIQEVPQVGADLLNLGLVNKCPSGYAKLSNLSLTNHYARYYESVTGGQSDSISLTRREHTIPVLVWRGQVLSSVTRVWYESYLDTIPMTILAGESVTQNFVGVIGCISDSDSDVPITLGITVKYRARNGQELYKDVATIQSESPVIEDTDFMQSVTWTAEQDYMQAEPIIFMRTKYGRIHSTAVSHKGIKVDISTRKNLLSS